MERGTKASGAVPCNLDLDLAQALFEKGLFICDRELWELMAVERRR